MEPTLLDLTELFDNVPMELWEELNRIGLIAYGINWPAKRQELLLFLWRKDYIINAGAVQYLIHGIYSRYYPMEGAEEVEPAI